MQEQFLRNIPALSEEEQARLRASHAAVVGCGGLGGYIIEYLARIGVGHLTVIDGDRFEPTNLNRQLLSSADTMEQAKAEAASSRVRSICPETSVRDEAVFLSEENADSLLEGADVVMDALDSGASRLILAHACRERGIPLIHGAIQGWNAQIAVCPPESHVLEQLYGAGAAQTSDKSCLSFTPALCAAIQCAEATKILTGREPALRGRLLMVDLRYMDFETIEIG